MPTYSSPNSSITSYDIVFDTNRLDDFMDASGEIEDALSRIEDVESLVNRSFGTDNLSEISREVSRVGSIRLSGRFQPLLTGRIRNTQIGRELLGNVSDVRRSELRLGSFRNLESVSMERVSNEFRNILNDFSNYRSSLADLQRTVRRMGQVASGVESGAVPYTGAELDGFASGLTVHFKQGSYTYTSASVGQSTIDMMIELAENNSGLQGFINRTLR